MPSTKPASPTPVPDLMIATPDVADPRLDAALQGLLRLIRSELQMDVAFLAEFVAGRRVFRQVDASAPAADLVMPGDSHAIEDSICQRVVDGRVPRIIQDVHAVRAQLALPAATGPVGAHAGVPVRLRDGTVYGTLCCFSFAPNMDLDDLKLKRLEMSAQMAGRLLDEAGGGNTLPAA